MTDLRPALTPDLSGEELTRWYWRKDELVAFARQIGTGTGGGKHDLLARLAAALDGRPLPQPPPAARRPPAARLPEPLTPDTVLPDGQRCSQQLRAFFRERIGAAFHFDAAMREFIATGAGRTLGEAVRHWHATRQAPPSQIGAQFELNRFLRDWHAAHPGAGRHEALQAWRHYRSLPVEARQGPGGQADHHQAAAPHSPHRVGDGDPLGSVMTAGRSGVGRPPIRAGLPRPGEAPMRIDAHGKCCPSCP
ncbi:DUF6434 domain-containing protein [Planobispora siamensis]|nr:DUF6434 domain-containing protein [Planobispora siamensis]